MGGSNGIVGFNDGIESRFHKMATLFGVREVDGGTWLDIVQVKEGVDAACIQCCIATAVFPPYNNVIEPWLTIVVWMCTVDLTSGFGMILGVTVQDLRINVQETVQSKCFKNMRIERKRFTDAIT